MKCIIFFSEFPRGQYQRKDYMPPGHGIFLVVDQSVKFPYDLKRVYKTIKFQYDI